MKDYVNWAILAPGIIANSMAKAITETAKKNSKIKPYAVASRDKTRGEEFASKWGFEKAYGSYEELFNDPDVDIIYIANPHAFHFDSVMQALKAKKHILCEKPAGCNIGQLNAMIDLAKKNNLFFMEAMWTAFNPCINQIVKTINEGTIGKVKHIDSRFCNRIPYDPENRLYAPYKAGGALLDLGIYNIYFAMKIAGTTKIINHDSTVRLLDGVDVWNSVNMTFENGITTGFQSAADMPSGSNTHDAIIFGEKGFITVQNFFMAQKAQVHLYTNEWGNENKVAFDIDCPFDVNGYEYEMITATECILNGKTECDVHPYSTSIALCNAMDSLRKDWKMVYPFEK